MRVRGKFTLIELLVVIAIIAILFSLLLPGLKKAGDSAQRVNCAGKLRQIGFAAGMYIEDYKRVHPSCAEWPSGTYYLWEYFISTMLDNSASRLTFVDMPIFRCPGYNNCYSYSMNHYLSNKYPSIAKKPSEILYIADRREGAAQTDILSNSVDNIGFRHLARANILWFDFHVSDIKIDYAKLYGAPPNAWREDYW
jgi:prepilin-type N-terminal cleavage/methylation domain-containing protein/prepilin-type processing-associated H-X9-DG protein